MELAKEIIGISSVVIALCALVISFYPETPNVVKLKQFSFFSVLPLSALSKISTAFTF